MQKSNLIFFFFLLISWSLNNPVKQEVMEQVLIVGLYGKIQSAGKQSPPVNFFQLISCSLNNPGKQQLMKQILVI